MKLKVSRILHAGYLFECENNKILFDPIFENPFSHNCYAYPAVKFKLEEIKKLKVDAIFISHFHDDHCSFESLNHLDRNIPIYIFCLFPELAILLKELGFKHVHSLNIDESIFLGNFEIITRRALDAEVDSIFHIKAAGLNVLNVVDSWIDDETMNKLKETSPWDLILWPFQTMRELEVLSPHRLGKNPVEIPPEWISQIEILNPRYIIASSCQFIHESWSWYNQAFFPISYERFKTEIKQEVIRLDPSKSLHLDKYKMNFSEPLPWINLLENDEVDYHFKRDLIAPIMNDFARNFRALSESEKAQVIEFCETTMIEKFESDEPYFSSLRLWKLSLYDHEGFELKFFYGIEKGKLNRLTFVDEKNLAWTTEIPLSKLYDALFQGESLTSLYVRINDREFSPNVEKELKEVDLLEDPLIRTLFDQEFASYQKAQLKKINNLMVK